MNFDRRKMRVETVCRVLLFLFSGYLNSFSKVFIENLSNLAHDHRTEIGFLTFDSRIHYYELNEQNKLRIFVHADFENSEDFLPVPKGIFLNFFANRRALENFLNELPKIYASNREKDSALGVALQAAKKLLSKTGGRLSVFQSRTPNIEPGLLSEKQTDSLRETSPFYKQIALEMVALQISCDLFFFNKNPIDVPTLGSFEHFHSKTI